MLDSRSGPAGEMSGQGLPADRFLRAGEKLGLALQVLCADGALGDRLEEAVMGPLLQIDPRRDLPTFLAAEYAAFIAAMTGTVRVRDGGPSGLRVQHLDHRAMRRAADQVVAFYVATCRHLPPKP